MDVYEFILEELKRFNITLASPVKLSDCNITRKYLLEREGIDEGGVVMMALPYLSEKNCGEHNISAYCSVKDYHAFFDMLRESLIPLLKSEFPCNKFALFADHSPIDERDAAAKAGLGVIGMNQMLITEKYSSYVFLGEIVTDAPIDNEPYEIRFCEGCKLCQKLCPASEIGNCLSAVTQQKQDLSDTEKAAMIKHNTAWGCDICQRVCPHTLSAMKNGTIFTEIEYFLEDIIPDLNEDILNSLDDEAFRKRAFAWRGRKTIERNLKIMEKKL